MRGGITNSSEDSLKKPSMDVYAARRPPVVTKPRTDLEELPDPTNGAYTSGLMPLNPDNSH
jgi:hypothetical protein